MTEVVYFYSVEDEYGDFSNFARYPIRLKGKTWPTSEHYFQAMKFIDPIQQQKIRQATTPMEAARMGRDRKQKLRRDWESVKDQVMYEAVQAKFVQHPELAEQLLATQNAKIVEHTEQDSYWGDGGDGSGKNKLGQILMRVRTKLQSV